jgi:hypothetical protein
MECATRDEVSMAARHSKDTGRATRVALEEVIQHLRQIQSAVIVAVSALRHQGAERDEDIANVLQHTVVDGLEDQIEKTEHVLRSL